MMPIWFLITEKARKALVVFQRKYYPDYPVGVTEPDDDPKVSIRPSVENVDEISRLMKKPTKQRLAK